MVDAIWPLTLPQEFLASGFGDTEPEDNIIKDDLNVGPPIYRRRTTSAPEKFAGEMIMTTEEWETLSTFFHATLFDGVTQFLFPPQATTDVITSWVTRFVAPPKRTMSDADDSWNVFLSLERLGLEASIPPEPLGAEAQAYIDATGYEFTGEQEQIIDDFFTNLMSGLEFGSNVFAKLDYMHWYGMPTEMAASINMIDPETYTATTSGGPVFTAYEGYIADGGDYIDTNFNPSTAVHFSQNSAMFAVYNLNSLPANTAPYGRLVVGTGATINHFTSGALFQIRINQTATDAISATTVVTLLAANRSGASALQLYSAGVLVDTGTTASQAVINGTLRLGFATTTSARAEVMMSCAGESLTANEHADLYAAVEQFKADFSVVESMEPELRIIATGFGDVDGCPAGDVTGSGLGDLLLAEVKGRAYWLEQTSPREFTPHIIRGTQIGLAKQEGSAWIDVDGDGELEAVIADQTNGDVVIFKQDVPGTPTGTWTRAVIQGDRPNIQFIGGYDIDNDGRDEIYYCWEGDTGGGGGVNWLDWQSGSVLTAANYNDHVMIVRTGAWWSGGFHDFANNGGGLDLVYSSRRIVDHTGTAADPGVFWLERPVTITDPWTEHIITDEVDDWTHVTVGNFFGTDNRDVAAVTGEGGGPTETVFHLFDYDNAWAETEIETDEDVRYNVKVTGEIFNGRNVLLVAGVGIAMIWEWDGAAWVMRKSISLGTAKFNGQMPFFDNRYAAMAESTNHIIMLWDTYSNLIVTAPLHTNDNTFHGVTVS